MEEEAKNQDLAAPVEEASPEMEAAPAAVVEPVAETPAPLVEATLTESPDPTPTEEIKESAPMIEDSGLLDRLGELESKIKDYETRDVERLRLDKEAGERSRDALLKEYGIIDPLYSRMAPTLADADPRTPDGKESYRQWMTKHPNLFKKSPSLEKITDGAAQEVRKGFGQKLSFGDAIRKLRG